MHRRKIKQSLGSRIFDVCNVLFMLALCTVMIYPYLNQLAMSLNDGKDAMRGGITIFPRVFTWQNYETIFKNNTIVHAAVISVARTVLGTVFGLTVTTAAAYPLSLRKLPYRKQITWFLILPTFISAGLIPGFILMRELKLIGTFWVYVIPGAFSFYNMVIMRSYMQSLPESLIESAELDGANDIQTLVSIILPLCKPVLATVTLWVAVGHWNEWVSTMYYNETKPKLYTLQYLLMKLVKESETIKAMVAEMQKHGSNAGMTITATPETVKSATLIVITLPIILLYPFLQKYFIHGVTLGAVKE